MNEPMDLFEGVHLGIEVRYLEHSQGGVQSECVHIAGCVRDAAAPQQCLQALEEVKDTSHLLVLETVISEVLDKLESKLHTLSHLSLLIQRGERRGEE